MKTQKFTFAAVLLATLFALTLPVQAQEEIIIVEEEPMGSSDGIWLIGITAQVSDLASQMLEACVVRSDSRSFDFDNSAACCSASIGSCVGCAKGAFAGCLVATFRSTLPSTPTAFQDIIDGTSNTIMFLEDVAFAPFTSDEVFDPGSTIVAPNNVRPILNACLAASDRRVRLSVPLNSRVQCCSADMNYCLQCRQDGRGVCIQSPYATNWSTVADGYVPPPTRRTNNSSSGSSSGGGPIIID